ncbi:hypothetical protein PTKIN_Ptkin03bG0023000 [Pterospermum kingtungense]
MGASGSKIEEDKALQLCRERRKYVRQALDGRCSLAAAHVAYIETLKSTGTVLRKFVELEAPVESSLYTSTNATPEPLALTEKSLSQFSYSSPSFSQRVDATETFSPSPSPPTSSHFHVNHMKFGIMSSQKVEEKPTLSDIRLVTSSSTPRNNTPRSTDKPQSSPFEASSMPPGTPQWDFFGLWHPIDHQFSFQEGKELNQGSETVDHLRQVREEEGLPELEDEEEASLHEREETQASEDEFDDEPPTDTLVRSFENLNRVNDHKVANASTTVPSAGSVTVETDSINGGKTNSPDLSPLRGTPSSVSIPTEIKKTPIKEDGAENKVAPKDFLSVMKDIEVLFIKASDSGKEVPRMLEANKFHFRPIFPGKEGGLTTSKFFKACFSCGEDPSQVKEEVEPPQTAVKYLTWHRTTSSRSSSSANPLGLNSKDDVEELSNNLFNNTCMFSGSHASTLDRLYAWERKLYDEVKASELVRSEYELKCKSLRQLESTAESSRKIDKTRAVIKDLHSRIRVAIHRIHSISKRIEDLRDNELQPQLEELIEGLSRMWDVMAECHRRQFQIISVAYQFGNIKISVQSESHRQITAHLEDELRLLSSSFTKWIGAQKAYLKAINSWLEKCVTFPQKSMKKSRRANLDQVLRKFGPPIYVTCGVWYDKLNELEQPVKEVSNSIKRLAADTSGFLPHQEKTEGKKTNHQKSESVKDDSDSAMNMSRDDAMKERMSASRKDDDITDAEYNIFRNDALKDSFRTSLVYFLGQLKSFAEASVKMFKELDGEIQKRKSDMSVQGVEFGNDESNVKSNHQSNNQGSSSNQGSDRSKDQLKPQA